MESLSPRERLLRVLRKEPVDRAPVICTGGMMNSAIVEIMQRTGHTLPEAHFDAARMAALARDVQSFTGFENVGVPFCMTIEAELLGSEINHGTLACEPKIAREVFPTVRDVTYGNVEVLANSGRMNVVVEAALRISTENPDVPVVASLTGPISTAASIVDPLAFYKSLRRDPDGAHQVLDYVTRLLSAFARRLLEQGATAIAVGDPSATGEILGPAMFEKFAVRYINQLADDVHALGYPLILHICGDLGRVSHCLPMLRCDALSTDAMVNLVALKTEFPQITTMGNLSTYALEWNAPEKIAAVTRKLVASGIDIISPACGLSTATRLQSIRAMTDTVTRGEK
jgi:[methyl-Co(III) methanol-specific corrinoid protein]:coenzyme M methyltransferase